MHVAHTGEKRNMFTILVANLVGKRPLGRTRYRLEDIKMDLREIGWEGRDWIYLAQDIY